jgi:hypothetical protein
VDLTGTSDVHTHSTDGRSRTLDLNISFITIILYHALSHMLKTTAALHISLPDENKARDRLREQ